MTSTLRKPHIVCGSDAFGYGPTSILLTCVRHLTDAAQLTFVGDGVALEMARREEALDCRQVSASDYAATCADLLSEADVLVSALDFELAGLGLDCGVPTVLVDSLGWMWKEPVHDHRLARYFVQRFPGIESRQHLTDDRSANVEFVGPLIETSHLSRTRSRNQILVNLGGLASPLMPAEVQKAYALAVGHTLSTIAELQPYKLMITGGSHAMSWLEAADLPANFRCASLAQDDYLAELAASDLLLTAAGLSATLEGFQLGVPTAFLPPQNMSQELTIDTLSRAATLGAGSTWTARYGLRSLWELAEVDGCRAVNQAIIRFSSDDAAQAEIGKEIGRFVVETTGRPSAWQSEFVEALGPPGAARIEGFLRELIAAPVRTG